MKPVLRIRLQTLHDMRSTMGFNSDVQHVRRSQAAEAGDGGRVPPPPKMFSGGTRPSKIPRRRIEKNKEKERKIKKSSKIVQLAMSFKIFSTFEFNINRIYLAFKKGPIRFNSQICTLVHHHELKKYMHCVLTHEPQYIIKRECVLRCIIVMFIWKIIITKFLQNQFRKRIIQSTISSLTYHILSNPGCSLIPVDCIFI